MKDLKNKLTTSGKGSTNIQSRRAKSFGYQVLGFGSGGAGASYIVATGGSPCSGAIVCTDYKQHTFTGPGTFCVSNAGSVGGSNTVDYMVVAGGGGGGGAVPGGGSRGGGGGGAGGYRESSGTASGCYTASPLGACVSALPVSVQGYPITVGGGGAGAPSGASLATKGSNSIFSTITSTGGGYAVSNDGYGVVGASDGGPGGSGGGLGSTGGSTRTAGAGNTPPVSPQPQGNPSGGPRPNGDYAYGTSGGGAGGAGKPGTPGNYSACIAGGGAGVATSITGSPVTRAEGGWAGDWGYTPSGYPNSPSPKSGSANTGDGGGGSDTGPLPQPGWPGGTGGTGGSGVVIIRYKFQ